MIQRIVPLLALTLCLSQPAVVLAQLTMAEYKVFTQLLTEPDSKESLEKRLKLIGDAIERQADPKWRPTSSYQVNLKQSRIPAVEGVPFLMKWLDHPAEVVKRPAMRMMGFYGPEANSAVPKLQQLMKLDSNRNVRDDAMLTLTKIDPSNAEIAAAILERLGVAGADDSTKRAVLQALIAMAPVVPKSAVPQISMFQEHPRTDMGIYTHELIGKVLALERPTLEQLRKMKTIDWRNVPDRGYSIFATIAEAGNKAEFAVPLLLGVLDSAPPPYLECVAVDTLAKTRTGNPQALTAFLDRLTAKDMLVRAKAGMALPLIDLQEPASVRVLAAGLRNKDQRVRLEAAQALWRWDEPRKLSPAARDAMLIPLLELFAELDDSVPPGHLETYLSLLRRFGTRAAPAAEGLVKFYQSEPFFKKQGVYGVHLRGLLLATLATIGVPESGRELVLSALQKGPTDPIDGGYAYTAAAHAAASFTQPKPFVPLLLPGLKVKSPGRAFHFSSDAVYKPTTVRVETIRALGRIGPSAEEALPLLRAIVEGSEDTTADPDLIVQQEARRAFQAIGGMRLPFAKGFFTDGKKEMLHLDERLQVKMTLKLRNPRPQDILKRLQQATNLTFTMGEDIDPGTPVVSSMFSVGVPALYAMRQLAAAPNVQGAWEDFGDGYRLVCKKKSPSAQTAKAFPPFKDDSFDPLPDDPRLEKKVTIRLSKPKIQDILQVIRDGTGVAVTVENVDADLPLYNSADWSVPAWFAMRNVAESQHVEGTWEKVGEGYRLRGTHPARPSTVAKAPTTPDAVTRAVEPSAAAPGSHISLYLGVGLFFTIVVGTASALVLRRLGRKDS